MSERDARERRVKVVAGADAVGTAGLLRRNLYYVHFEQGVAGVEIEADEPPSPGDRVVVEEHKLPGGGGKGTILTIRRATAADVISDRGAEMGSTGRSRWRGKWRKLARALGG